MGFTWALHGLYTGQICSFVFTWVTHGFYTGFTWFLHGFLEGGKGVAYVGSVACFWGSFKHKLDAIEIRLVILTIFQGVA